MDWLTEAYRWAIGLALIVVIPAIWRFATKIINLFRDVETLQKEKVELKECVMAKLDEIEEKIDRNSEEHAEVIKELQEVKEKVGIVENDVSWLKKNGS